MYYPVVPPYLLSLVLELTLWTTFMGTLLDLTSEEPWQETEGRELSKVRVFMALTPFFWAMTLDGIALLFSLHGFLLPILLNNPPCLLVLKVVAVL